METNNQKNGAVFDKEAEYEERVVPLIEKLRDVCKELDMPFMFWVIYKLGEPDDKTWSVGQGLVARNTTSYHKLTLLANVAGQNITIQEAAGMLDNK